MPNEKTTKKKIKVGLFDYLFMLLLVIYAATASIIIFVNRPKTSEGGGSNPDPQQVITYNVKLMGDAKESFKVNEGGLITKPDNPTKEGYTFGGWYKDEECLYQWNFASDKVTADTSLYPKWTVNTFTVSFDMNKHGDQIDPQIVNYNELVIKPDNPTATGYTFGGWYKEKACENAWNFKDNKITANVSLFAKWTEVPAATYTVTFNLKGHGSAIDSQTKTAGSLVTKPTNPTAGGYTFDGWCKDEACEYKWNFDVDPVTANTTLYAKWIADPVTASYTVEFNLNGHGSAVDSQTISEGGLVIEPTAPTDEDYGFDGWFKDEECEYQWDFATDTVNSDTTLYAKWIEYRYVAFELGLDQVYEKYHDCPIIDEIPYQKIPYCRLVTTPTSPVDSDDDFVFVGWYRDPNFSVEWDFANDVITKNTTLYARWSPKICRVTFDFGSETVTNMPVYVDVSAGSTVASLGIPQSSDYPSTTFGGWSVVIDETTQPCNPEYIIYDNLTLLAYWQGVI